MRLHILLLFLLTSGWVCNGDQTNRIIGGVQEQNASDPKYQKMANELVHYFLHVRDQDTKNITVTKVTTQVVSGIITRIQLRLFLVSGQSTTCDFNVWEQKWKNAKYITHKCDSPFREKLSSSNKRRPEKDRNPTNLKYLDLAQLSIASLFETPGRKPFEKEDVKKISVSRAKVEINSEIKITIEINVITVKNDHFKCTSKVVEAPWTPDNNSKIIDINCTIANGETENLPGGLEPQNPKDPKYKELAIESLKNFEETDGFKEINVTNVTTQVVSGIITRIDFTVIPIKGESFSCHSEIIEQIGNNTIFSVSCDKKDSSQMPGGLLPQNPTDPKYKQLATESFEKYQQINGFIKVKELKVNKVTTQEVSGVITRIDFNVIPTIGKSFSCHSRIIEQEWIHNKIFSVSCDKKDSSQMPGGLVPQNPNDPKYKQLAMDSFKNYQQSNGFIRFKELKITKVTTQVVSGVITRIEFTVIPIQGQKFACRSQIIEQKWGNNKTIGVTCDRQNNPHIPGGLVPQNPKNPKYKQLATESFEKYQQTNGFTEVKELKVNKVTTQVVSVVIIRINFNVIPTRGKSFSCHSRIIEQEWVHNKIFSVTCDKEKNPKIPGGLVIQNPNNPKYKQLATESFRNYQQNNGFIRFKELKITKVTTQVVSGVITRIEFTVIPIEGQRFACRSQITEQKWVDNKIINVTCDKQKNPHIPGGLVPQNPKDPKYKQLATESLKNYQHTNGFIKVKELKVTKVTTQVVSGVITRIDFNVIPSSGKSFSCHSQITEKWGHNKIFRVTCDKEKKPEIPGGLVPENPNDPKYNHLATKSFRNYQQTNGFIGVKELKVTKVTTQVVSGLITTIEFIVIPIKGQQFACRSQITEQNWGSNKIISVTCDRKNNPQVPGGLVPQNPNDPKYKQLATKSFKQYQKTYRNVKVKDIKVAKVTTQIVSGVITRIEYDVIPIAGKSLSCHSEIVQENWVTSITCYTKKYPLVPGGEVSQNPDHHRYKNLAKESFKKFQETNGVTIVKHIIVNKVTTQVVAGIITRIDFTVTPIKGQPFICHSEIFEQKWVQGKNIKVNCEISRNPDNPKNKVGSEEEQNPNDPKYYQLAKESFQEFQRYSDGPPFQVERYKVTKVTTQLVQGLLTRVNFNVILISGQLFQCQSEIMEKSWEAYKGIIVKCHSG
ncbi:uncharacterized protein LOC133528598 isoform X1 [Cydia pomonella]|uniref:uncharacterized protein LOC133528598 isoform X1 n=1 Tax=Cydia pomonella TaxID=82600 RepID=UPI002ADD7D16|nr:uncharacterized protein LOC133528598 isoform X1 [Cydia pomonella]